MINDLSIDRVGKVLTHIQNVQRNCYKLGVALMKSGKMEMGRNLIVNGQVHDNSKLKGIEFDHLLSGSPILNEVVKHHATTNPHHPEYWGGIYFMPDIYIAEMVCDCAARSSEFGTSVRNWFIDRHPEKYGYKLKDVVDDKIQFYLNMLLDNGF